MENKKTNKVNEIKDWEEDKLDKSDKCWIGSPSFFKRINIEKTPNNNKI